MKTCPPDSELNAILNESLDPSRATRIVDHVESCERCQQQLESICLASSSVAVGGSANPAVLAEWNNEISNRAVSALQADMRLAGPSLAPKSSPVAKRRLALYWPILAVVAAIFVLPPIAARLLSQLDKEGNIEIEINDSDTTLSVSGASSFSHGGIDYRRQPITPGKHSLTVQRGDSIWKQPNLELKDGDIIRVRVERAANSLAIYHNDQTLATHALRESLQTP